MAISGKIATKWQKKHLGALRVAVIIVVAIVAGTHLTLHVRFIQKDFESEKKNCRKIEEKSQKLQKLRENYRKLRKIVEIAENCGN